MRVIVCSSEADEWAAVKQFDGLASADMYTLVVQATVEQEAGKQAG